MNKHLLRQYIADYKLDFETVNKQEIYKWQAVKCFQDNWNLDQQDFFKMLDAAFNRTENLLDSGNYFPLRMIRHYAERKPTDIKRLFENLYNEEDDLFERIENFQKDVRSINEKLFPGKSSYQDHRAIIVYLVLRYPERYFFYKFEMFKKYSEKLDLVYRPKKGRIENIGHFNSQCELIRHELALDQDLIMQHKNRITEGCYFDESLNILTQDFIYFVANNYGSRVVPRLNTVSESPLTHYGVDKKSIEELIQSADLKVYFDNVNFKGRTINFIQSNSEKKRIGDLGELWAMKYELDKLTKAQKSHLLEKVKHISKDEGDGTGYDIQSFDTNGNPIFIEVKTTKGDINSPFYVTRNELEKSKIVQKNYFVYRIYNFDEEKETADILIIQGELTNLCCTPTSYKINLFSK